MHVRRILLLGCVGSIFAMLSVAQDVVQMDEQALRQHVASQVPAVYRPIAKAARIEGRSSWKFGLR